MGNTKNGSVWHFDTAGVISTNEIKIKAMCWVGTDNSGKDIAADDDLQITTDSAGATVIFEKRAEANHEVFKMEFGDGVWWPPCYLKVLEGGELTLFVA